MELKLSTFLASYKDYVGDPENFDIAEALKRDGFDGAEPDHYSFVLRKEDPLEGAKKLREKLDAVGIPTACYSRGMTMVDNSVEECVERLKSSIDVCEALGSPILHHTIQNSWFTPVIPLWEKHLDKFVEICREAAYYAGEKGITCIYEDQGFYVNTPERLSELLSRVDLPNTGICFDTGNALFYEVDPIDYVAMLAPFIKHVHIKDYLRKPAHQTPPQSGFYRTARNNMLRTTIIGHGVIDFGPIMSTLILAGYKGYFSIEAGGIEHDNLRALQESIRNIKWMYNTAKQDLIERGYLKEQSK